MMADSDPLRRPEADQPAHCSTFPDGRLVDVWRDGDHVCRGRVDTDPINDRHNHLVAVDDDGSTRVFDVSTVDVVDVVVLPTDSSNHRLHRPGDDDPTEAACGHCEGQLYSATQVTGARCTHHACWGEARGDDRPRPDGGTAITAADGTTVETVYIPVLDTAEETYHRHLGCSNGDVAGGVDVSTADALGLEACPRCLDGEPDDGRPAAIVAEDGDYRTVVATDRVWRATYVAAMHHARTLDTVGDSSLAHLIEELSVQARDGETTGEANLLYRDLWLADAVCNRAVSADLDEDGLSVADEDFAHAAVAWERLWTDCQHEHEREGLGFRSGGEFA